MKAEHMYTEEINGYICEFFLILGNPPGNRPVLKKTIVCRITRDDPGSSDVWMPLPAASTRVDSTGMGQEGRARRRAVEWVSRLNNGEHMLGEYPGQTRNGFLKLLPAV